MACAGWLSPACASLFLFPQVRAPERDPSTPCVISVFLILPHLPTPLSSSLLFSSLLALTRSCGCATTPKIKNAIDAFHSRAESLGRSLAGLLQGPATDRLAVSALMAQLLRHEEAGTVLTNYRKGGEEFRNRLRVSPLGNERGEVSHFVGVLGEAGEGA